jgi:hypothetical protein
VKGSVQDVAEQKVSATLQVQADAERLIASVRSLLATDYRLYEAMEKESNQWKALSLPALAGRRISR